MIEEILTFAKLRKEPAMVYSGQSQNTIDLRYRVFFTPSKVTGQFSISFDYKNDTEILGSGISQTPY